MKKSQIIACCLIILCLCAGAFTTSCTSENHTKHHASADMPYEYDTDGGTVRNKISVSYEKNSSEQHTHVADTKLLDIDLFGVDINTCTGK